CSLWRSEFHGQRLGRLLRRQPSLRFRHSFRPIGRLTRSPILGHLCSRPACTATFSRGSLRVHARARNLPVTRFPGELDKATLTTRTELVRKFSTTCLTVSK